MLAAAASSTVIQIHVIGSLDGSREIGTESAEPRLKRPRRVSANAGGDSNVSFCILAIVGTDKGRWAESFKNDFVTSPAALVMDVVLSQLPTNMVLMALCCPLVSALR